MASEQIAEPKRKASPLDEIIQGYPPSIYVLDHDHEGNRPGLSDLVNALSRIGQVRGYASLVELTEALQVASPDYVLIDTKLAFNGTSGVDEDVVRGYIESVKSNHPATSIIFLPKRNEQSQEVEGPWVTLASQYPGVKYWGKPLPPNELVAYITGKEREQWERHFEDLKHRIFDPNGSFSGEDFAALHLMYRTRHLKGLVWGIDPTDQHVEPWTVVRELDPTRPYNPDAQVFAKLKAFPVGVAEAKYSDALHFRDHPTFRLPVTISPIEDGMRNVAYYREEIILGPTVSQVLLQIREKVESDKAIPAVYQENLSQLQTFLFAKAVRNLVEWQKQNKKRVPFTGDIGNIIRREYRNHMADVLQHMDAFSDIRFSPQEQHTYGESIDVLDDTLIIDPYTATLKLDASFNNMVLKTGILRPSLEETLSFFRGEGEKIDRRRVENRFYHFDQRGDTVPVPPSGHLQDFFHMVDSVEGNLSIEERKGIYWMFLLAHIYDSFFEGNPKGNKRGLWDNESKWKRDILTIIGAFEEGRTYEMDAIRAFRPIEHYNKNRFEEAIHRNARKAALWMTVYGANNHRKYEQGLRGEEDYVQRRNFIETAQRHHLQRTVEHLDAKLDALSAQLGDGNVDAHVQKERERFISLYQKTLQGLTGEVAAEFSEYFKKLRRYIQQDDPAKEQFGTLLQTAKFGYLRAAFGKMAAFKTVDYGRIVAQR